MRFVVAVGGVWLGGCGRSDSLNLKTHSRNVTSRRDHSTAPTQRQYAPKPNSWMIVFALTTKWRVVIIPRIVHLLTGQFKRGLRIMSWPQVSRLCPIGEAQLHVKFA